MATNMPLKVPLIWNILIKYNTHIVAQLIAMSTNDNE